MTGGARGGDRRALPARLLAVAFARRSRERDAKPGRGTRATCVAGEPNRLHQRHVAGDARGVGRLEVRGPDAVAVEAVPHHGQLHLHGIGAALGVAGAALERWNRRRRPPDLLGVARVGELEIAGAWGRPAALQSTVSSMVPSWQSAQFAGCGPERGAWNPPLPRGSRRRWGRARDAASGRSDPARTPGQRPCRWRARRSASTRPHQRPEPHRLPARGRVRSAGGSRNGVGSRSGGAASPGRGGGSGPSRRPRHPAGLAISQ